MKAKNILYGVAGLGALYLGYRAFKKSKDSSNSKQESIIDKPIGDSYNKQDATSKALSTVKDWIKTYDTLPQDVLNQKSKNFFTEEQALKNLKAKTNPSKTDLMEISLYEQRISMSNNLLLKDAVKRLKDLEYQKVYNVLKDLYAEYPKADVDKLMVILPTYLSGMLLGDDYKYSYDVYDKLSLEDKLFLSDTNFQKKFEDAIHLKYPKKTTAVVSIG